MYIAMCMCSDAIEKLRKNRIAARKSFQDMSCEWIASSLVYLLE